LEQIAQIMTPLPPLRERKRPWLAFVLGFLFSGIALGIYFRSWVDLIVPTVIWLVLIATPGDAGFLGGCGYRRAVGASQGRQRQREAECGRDVVIGPPSQSRSERPRVRSGGCSAT